MPMIIGRSQLHNEMVPSIGAADYLTVDPQRNSESLLPSWWIMLLRVSC